MTDTVNVEAPATTASLPLNPFDTALVTILCFGYLIGAIMLLVGGSMYADPTDAAAESAALPVLVWGGSFFNVAVLATFSKVIVSAVHWNSRHALVAP